MPAAIFALFESSASVDNTQRGIQASQEAKSYPVELTSFEESFKGQRMKIRDFRRAIYNTLALISACRAEDSCWQLLTSCVFTSISKYL